MKARAIRPVITVVLAVAAFVPGCDPKIVGLEGDGGTPGLPEDEVPASVTPEALVVGNIAAFHTDLAAAALSVSATFDSAAAPLRAISASCAAMDELPEGQFARYELLFDGCVDGNGTTYRGGGQLARVNEQDGYTFLPLFEAKLLRAINETNEDYNHTVLSPASTAGSLEFTFQRGQSGEVTGVTVGKFLRHGVRGDTVTFSYADVAYSGAIGSHAAYPDIGSTIRVVWDGVGLFDLTFEASGQAVYTMQGVDYTVNLATGAVSVLQQ